MSPAVLLEQLRTALAASYNVDLRGHAEDTRRAVHRVRVALLEAEDVLAYRAGETLTRGAPTQGPGRAPDRVRRSEA